MKHPLTSKERRGLLAVAAAALLCIGMGFVARSCGSHSSKGAVVVVEEGVDSVYDISEQSENSEFESSNGKRARREKRKKASKKKAEKSYPVRDPLSQPCD